LLDLHDLVLQLLLLVGLLLERALLLAHARDDGAASLIAFGPRRTSLTFRRVVIEAPQPRDAYFIIWVVQFYHFVTAGQRLVLR